MREELPRTGAPIDVNHAGNMRYDVVASISDCNMLVVDGDWQKQLEYGPSSFVARVCGKSIVHMASLKANNASPTQLDPAQLKVAHFLPLSTTDRCTVLKVFISDACKLKHKSFFEQLCMLAALFEGNEVPFRHRYKFSLVNGDVSCIVGQIESCISAAVAYKYRWLVVKEELDASKCAAAAALSTTPSKVNIVMTVSEFVQTLGARNAAVDQNPRHA